METVEEEQCEHILGPEEIEEEPQEEISDTPEIELPPVDAIEFLAESTHQAFEEAHNDRWHDWINEEMHRLSGGESNADKP